MMTRLLHVVLVVLAMGLLAGLQPHDPVTYALAGVGVLAVVVLASAVPARRASLVDPATALRMD